MSAASGARLRVIFMGTPQFAVPALNAVAAAHDVIAVYSQPPRPSGRGQHVNKSPVHLRAEALGIPVFHPEKLRTPETQQPFIDLQADVAVVAAYGLILPQAILDAPKYGCINIHASLLPRWRGASPIQHAIWKGDAESGITIMQMDKGLDTGDMLLKRSLPITRTMNATSLHDQLSAMGGPMIAEILANITALTPEKQDDTQSTYAPMLKKDDGRINWGMKARYLDRQIRALNPWPGTFCTFHDQRLKILSAELDDAPKFEPGRLLERNGRVATGDGALRLLKIQPDGGKAMDVSSAINGGYFAVGDVLT